MTGTVQGLGDVLQRMQSWLSFLPRITFTNIIEIIIIAVSYTHLTLPTN